MCTLKKATNYQTVLKLKNKHHKKYQKCSHFKKKKKKILQLLSASLSPCILSGCWS